MRKEKENVKVEKYYNNPNNQDSFYQFQIFFLLFYSKYFKIISLGICFEDKIFNRFSISIHFVNKSIYKVFIVNITSSIMTMM